MPRKRRRARSLRGLSVLAERCFVPRSAAVAERHQSCGVKSLEVLAEVAEDPKLKPSVVHHVLARTRQELCFSSYGKCHSVDVYIVIVFFTSLHLY